MDPRGPASDELRQAAASSREALGKLRTELRSADAKIAAEATQIGARATDLVEQLANQIANELASDLASQHEDQVEALRQEVAEQLAAVEADRAALVAERQAWVEERTEWETVRSQVEAELATIENRLVSEAQALKEKRSAAEEDGELLTQLQAAVSAQRAAEQKLADAESEVARLTSSLDEATRSLAAADQAEAELTTLRDKFEIAIADLQSHREHVAALEQEIADRPATASTDSAELDELRQERDELARRLEEAATMEGSDELDDLRDRFEMAVEDIRQLKTENAELRERNASAPAAADSTGDDWEAQKRRLLASLESEGESDDDRRQEERTTIAGTIQITDQVVTEKDAEIERLRAALEDRGEADDERAPADAAVAALLDEDAVIQAERERLANLEVEWREKLRAAELELSVERAKISRAQSELAQQELELETLRAANGTSNLAPGESRRNWFNKLGLGSEGG